jgi:hypothetical protein
VPGPGHLRFSKIERTDLGARSGAALGPARGTPTLVPDGFVALGNGGRRQASGPVGVKAALGPLPELDDDYLPGTKALSAADRRLVLHDDATALATPRPA